MRWVLTGVITEIEVCSSCGLGVGFIEVGCVSINVENHVTGMEVNDCIRVRGCIVEESSAGLHGCLCAGSLRGGNGVESFEDGVVNGTSIVEEHPDNLLDKFLGRRGQWW